MSVAQGHANDLFKLPFGHGSNKKEAAGLFFIEAAASEQHAQLYVKSIAVFFLNNINAFS